MTQYKDFQGKTLDDAIREACAYYGVAREKLEIEIVSDAKSGIFGLVGAKKARIRAARVQLPERVSVPHDNPPKETSASGETPFSSPGPPSDAEPVFTPGSGAAHDRPQRESCGNRTDRASEKGRSRREGGTKAMADQRISSGTVDVPLNGSTGDPGNQSEGGIPENAAGSSSHDAASAAGSPADGRSAGLKGKGAESPGGSPRASGKRNDERAPGKERRRESHRSPGQGRLKDAHPAVVDGPAAAMPDVSRDELPDFPLDGCDRDALFSVVCGVVQRLVEPIVGDAPCTVEIHGNRVRASIDCGDASGLLVGREGQTLAAVQYLASRIIAKRIGGTLWLHIDAGNYRERQDDKLKELALSLAERAKATRRAQSTRPLSAYQRRIIHLTLEEDEAVQTHSKGDGAQRRVIIQLKRAGLRGSGKDEGENDSAQPGTETPDGKAVPSRDEAFPKNDAHSLSQGDLPSDPDFHPEAPECKEVREV